MPGDSGVLVVTRVRSTNTKCTRGRGCNGHPAFPTPFMGGRIHAQLGRIAPRARSRMWTRRHCERSDPDSVIPGRCQRVRAKRGPMTGSASNPESRDSPMRNCASEVWSGACHRAAQSADPLGPSRNDGYGFTRCLKIESALARAEHPRSSPLPASGRAIAYD
jgi:hypothetical protein